MSLREEIAYELYDLFYEDIDYVHHPLDDQTEQFRKPWEEKADRLLSLPSLVELQKDANMWRGAQVIFKEILKTDDIEFIKSLAQDMLHPQWGGRESNWELF